MANPRGRVFPHVEAAKRNNFDTGQSLHLLWTKFVNQEETVTAQAELIRQQTTLLEDLQARHDALSNRVLTTTPPQGTAPTATSGTPPGGGGGDPGTVPDLFDQIVTARAAYGATMTNDECVALLNTVALANAGNGFGLLLKTTGNRGSQPTTGTQCSVDIIYHLPTNTLWDALIDAGHITAGPGQAKPQWSFVATLTTTTRFVAPV